MMNCIEIHIPDIGDFKAVEVIEILVKEGETIKADQALVTVESDKASMEIPSSCAGVVKELKVQIGDKVAHGSLLLMLAPDQAAEPAAVAPSSAPGIAAAPSPSGLAPTAALEPRGPGGAGSHASPSIRKFSRELGVDLARVSGTGQNGRITRDDVQNYIKLVTSAATGAVPAGQRGGLDLLPWPSLDFSKFGATALQPLSRIKKISGPNLQRNAVLIPHVTQFNEADVTELDMFRKTSNAAMAAEGVKLTMLALVMKACIAALKKFPAFNASLDGSGENLILKRYYHIGFAADTPNGLVVPVLKDVDSKGIVQIAQEMGTLAAQAREGKLKPADMQGASFTISSLGSIGGMAFTPIVNAPEVAILGLSKAEIRPVWDGNQFAPRLMLPMSLSYDHRAIDGAMGAHFSVYLASVLADIRTTLL